MSGVPEEEIEAMMKPYESVMMGNATTASSQADQLELFLAGELSRDHFEKAISFAQSRPSNTHKLSCLLRIVQTLQSRDF
jgi:hypothetical protein